ncbi:MAG: transcription termination factor Rho, partial [Ignavibacteriae bacterium]|nr:transcription termination factor Rho [Ignavibacteriota bacterium]
MVSTKTSKSTRATKTTKKASTPSTSTTSSTSATAEKGTNEKYEEIKKGDMHITALQKMTIKSLQDSAKKEGIKEYSGLKKQELIFKILKERVN